MRYTPKQAREWWAANPALTDVERAKHLREHMHTRSFNSFASKQLAEIVHARVKQKAPLWLIIMMRKKAKERELAAEITAHDLAEIKTRYDGTLFEWDYYDQPDAEFEALLNHLEQRLIG
jgi:hypothetical protein